MADLAPRPAAPGLEAPLVAGGVTLAAVPEAPMLSIAPFRGRKPALAEVLGAELPDPGGFRRLEDGAELIWAGLDLWLLRGLRATPDLAGRLANLAAVTDQSDGWTALALSGPGAADALARLVPLDLAPAGFPSGSAARTELRHMACLILARADGFELLVMRSFAASAIHEIAVAMRSVAARALLSGPERPPSFRRF